MMKLKDKYIRLNFARDELFETIGTERLPPTQCTNKLIKRILSEYGNWSMTEHMHCCNGWKTSCWQEFYAEGVWDMTYEQLIDAIKEVLTSVCKESRKLPVFYILEKNNEIKILISQRHKKFYERSDWIIFGKKLKTTLLK